MLGLFRKRHSHRPFLHGLHPGPTGRPFWRCNPFCGQNRVKHAACQSSRGPCCAGRVLAGVPSLAGTPRGRGAGRPAARAFYMRFSGGVCGPVVVRPVFSRGCDVRCQPESARVPVVPGCAAQGENTGPCPCRRARSLSPAHRHICRSAWPVLRAQQVGSVGP